MAVEEVDAEEAEDEDEEDGGYGYGYAGYVDVDADAQVDADEEGATTGDRRWRRMVAGTFGDADARGSRMFAFDAVGDSSVGIALAFTVAFAASVGEVDRTLSMSLSASAKGEGSGARVYRPVLCVRMRLT